VVAAVSIQNIRKQFGRVEVVRGVSLDIKPGEFIVLVGPSGCGKSTTLRMVAGLDEISAGRITIDGRVINDLAPKDRDVAMVFQNYALYPHLSVFENICFGLRLKRTREEEVRRAVHQAAEILDLTALLDRKPSDLSGGQRQRVAMGRAIVRNPKVFLFDEPLSNLDAKLRNQMRAEIKRLHARLGTTVIYVTHDQVEAMTLADRIVVMRDGNIEQIGTPTEVFDTPANAFVASFIGSPPMNLVPATVASGDGGPMLSFGDHGAIPAPAFAAARLAPGDAVLVGLRPEHLTVTDAPLPGAATISGVLDIVEPLGSETILHVSVGIGAPLIVRTNARLHVASGAPVTFSVALDNVHVFDAETRTAIR
jgi:multiple sugar transport system ATP-binding protein